MIMPPRVRKLALMIHVVVSVGWLGAAVAYVAVVGSALTTGSAAPLRAAYLTIGPMTWFAIVPLALAALATGLVQSLGTSWGLFRHYWVIYKLVHTVFATTILLLNTRTVTALARAAESVGDVGSEGLKGQLLHSAVGTLVLLITAGLAIYKPRGMTRYGWRKQYEQQDGRRDRTSRQDGWPKKEARSNDVETPSARK